MTTDGPSGAELAARAKHELARITGLRPEGVSELERSDDGHWKVVVELLEFPRIPDSLDVLGSYEVDLDRTGELLGYRRRGRYERARTGESSDPGPEVLP